MRIGRNLGLQRWWQKKEDGEWSKNVGLCSPHSVQRKEACMCWYISRNDLQRKHFGKCLWFDLGKKDLAKNEYSPDAVLETAGQPCIHLCLGGLIQKTDSSYFLLRWVRQKCIVGDAFHFPQQPQGWAQAWHWLGQKQIYREGPLTCLAPSKVQGGPSAMCSQPCVFVNFAEVKYFSHIWLQLLSLSTAASLKLNLASDGIWKARSTFRIWLRGSWARIKFTGYTVTSVAWIWNFFERNYVHDFERDRVEFLCLTALHGTKP